MTENKYEYAAANSCTDVTTLSGTAAEAPAREKRCYTVGDLQEILICGKRTVYDLLKKKEFSYIKLSGAGYRISKRSFDDWLDRQAG